MKINALNL